MNIVLKKVLASFGRHLDSHRSSSSAGRALIIADNLMNIGDLVLCVRAIELLRASHPELTISVWQWSSPSPNVRRTLAALPVKVEVESGKSFQALMQRYDSIVFAGGQAVRDTVSLPCLTTLLSKLTLAKLRGTSVSAVGIGVGPVTLSRRRLWRMLLRRIDYVSVRDADSLEHWSSIMGHGRSPELTADLAFGLAETTAPERGLSHATHILVAPCRSSEEQRGIALPELDQLISEIVEATSVSHLVLAAHDSRADKDPELCAELAQRYAARGLTIEVLASSEIDAYAAAYRDAVAVITNRFHGIVFGMLAGRPVFVLDDGCGKTRGAAARFGVPLVGASTASTTSTGSTASTRRLVASELQHVGHVARSEQIQRSQRAAAGHSRSL